MHYKRLISIIVVSMALLTNFLIFPSFADTYTSATVLVNNNKVQWGINPVYVGGQVYVPLKETANALGLESSFDINSLTAVIKMNENEVNLKLDNSIASLNGKNIPLSGAMKIIQNRVFIPITLFDNLGMFITQKDNTVLLFKPVNNKVVYKVVSGDMLWKIAQIFGTSVDTIKSLNNLTSDYIIVGQQLTVRTMPTFQTSFGAVTGNATIKSGPGFNYSDVGYLASGAAAVVTGKNGLWYKVNTARGNGYIYYTVIKVSQTVADTAPQSSFFNGKIAVDTSKNSITYSYYTVVSGDTLWSIATKTGVTTDELASVNGLSSSSYLYIGQKLKIPSHQIGVKQTPGSNFGEVLDWFSEAQYVFPIGKEGKLTDMQTGLSFNVRRTMGASHSDTETLTANDSAVMKKIFGGSWNWTRRAFILEVDGRKFAVSVSGMPHSGVDGAAFLQNVANRSGNYGYGPNYDAISGNQMDGHFDLYFLNGLRHSDNQVDPEHQKMVSIAGGLQ